MTNLTKIIMEEEKKKFRDRFGWLYEYMKKTKPPNPAFHNVEWGKHMEDFLDQAIQKTANKIMFHWKQAIIDSEDTKTCLDKRIMLNHFNEINELLTHSPNEVEKK